MGRIKAQREIRDFSMALVIKTYQNKNKKKNFFGEGLGPIKFFFFWGGGGGGGGPILFLFFIFSLKNIL
jgi:hypothetical protein